MDQAAHFPHMPPPPRGSRVAGLGVESSPAGTANLPFAVPEPGEKTELPRAVLIGSLRETIRKIERAAPLARSSSGSIAKSGSNNKWQLGCVEADALLPSGLEADSLHEVKAAVPISGAIAGAWMASLGFALRLAIRRVEQVQLEGAGTIGNKFGRSAVNPPPLGGEGLGVGGRCERDVSLSSLGSSPHPRPLPVEGEGSRACSQSLSSPRRSAPWILWCWPRVLAGELGRPSAAGLMRLGLDSAHIIFAETARADEALVALEDGLKSQSLALAIGVFKDIDLTPARRLSLAAGEGRTPCLAITHPASQPAGATATRWRIGWAPSAAHPFDAKASGNVRLRLQLERARARPQSVNLPPLLLEWSDETHRFGMASGLVPRAAETRVPQSRARG